MPGPKKYRLLCLLYYFPPVSVAAAQRAFHLLKYLDSERFDVTVLVPEHPDAAYPSSEFTQPIPDHITIVKVWSPPLQFWRKIKSANQSSPTRRKAGWLQKWYEYFIFPDKGAVWGRNACEKAAKIHRDHPFDAVFTSSPLVSTHRAILSLQRKNSIPWMCEFRDFYATHNSTLTSNKIKAQYLEESIFQTANYFLFVSKKMQEVYQNQYPGITNRCRTLNSGVDAEELERYRINASNASSSDGKKTLFYAGTFYNGLRDPLPFLRIFNQCILEGEIIPGDWIIQIAGPLEAHLLQELRDQPVLECLVLLGPLPRHLVLAYMSKATFCWLIVPDVDSHRDTIPAKLYEYWFFQKPILAFVPANSEAAHIIKEIPGMFLFSPDGSDGKSKILSALRSDVIPTPLPAAFEARQMSKSFQEELLRLMP